MDEAHQLPELHPLYGLHPQLQQSRNEHSVADQIVSVTGVEAPGVSLSTSAAVVSTVPPKVPVINHRSSISYRKIRPSDLEVLQEIHESLFPIKYEADFFMSVIHGRGIISWAAVDTSRSDQRCDELIGFVTARVITPSEGEELDLLGYEIMQELDMLGHEISKSDRTLIYILTLGVIQPYRNCGIASALLWEVIEYANQIPSCKALYLHVIAYNRPAITFYQKNMFQCLRRLPNFYIIEGQHHDAYLHVYYVNGSHSPCTAMYASPPSSLFAESINLYSMC